MAGLPKTCSTRPVRSTGAFTMRSSKAIQSSRGRQPPRTSPTASDGCAHSSSRTSELMQIGLHTKLNPGAEKRYEEYHRSVWPEVLAGMRQVGITKYVIFRDGLDLFHYIECEDYEHAIRSEERRVGK